MLISNRQGWRLLIVLSRLAVAGLLTVGLTLFADPVFAQTEPKIPPQPPPPNVAPRPPDPPAAEAHSDSTAPVPRETGPTAAEPAEAITLPPTLLSLPPSIERLSARRNSLNQVLCKDRRHHLLLERGDEALSSGDATAALMNFQALTEAAQDAFYWPTGSSVPRGAQTSVHQRLRSLPADVRQTCERLHGAEARALLSDSLLSDPLSQEREQARMRLLQRFPHTQAGREAMEQELLRAYDAGHTSLVLPLAQRLAADQYHWQQLSPDVQSLVSRLLDSASHPSQVDDANHVSPPALHPQWQYSFADGLTDIAGAVSNSAGASQPATNLSVIVNASAQEWFDERRERRLPTASANQAMVVGETLLVGDYAGLCAINIRSGERQWHWPRASSLAAVAAAQLRVQANAGGTPPLNFQTHFAGQGPRGEVTSDGQCVFLLDESPCQGAPSRDDDSQPRDRANRLIALPLHPSTGPPVPAWVQPGSADGPLAGHFFLGPPQPIDGRLFVLTELASRVECLALDATDGRLLWRQPIALTQHPIEWDSHRQRVACTPQFAAATVICPTEVGVLVGVDPLTGALRWVYDHIDDDQRHSAGRWSTSTQRNFGSCELPSRTLIFNECVIHLPFRSEYVHCVDAATGTAVWTAPRQDALSLSVATGHSIILLGQRDVISLSPHDGSVQWKSTCPEPAGHGIVAGDDYLLPLVDGRCLTISLVDGQPRGSRFSKLLHAVAADTRESDDADPPIVQLASHQSGGPAAPAARRPHAGGNLTATANVIVKSTPTGVAVYPMSAVQLNNLITGTEGVLVTDAERLQVALLHLVLDDPAAARSCLESLVGSNAPPHVSQPAARLLRELLFAQLQTAEDPHPVLDRIAQLPGDDDDALRLLVSRIDAHVQLGNYAELTAALEEFRGTDPDAIITKSGDTGFVVNAYSHVSDRLESLRNDSTTHATELSQYIRSVVEQSQQSAEIEELTRLVALLDGFPEAAPLKNQLAAACIRSDRLQQAELLLLSNCGSSAATSARAHRLLIDLYTAAGLQRDAAAHLLTLDEKFREADVGEGLRGVDYIRDLAPEHPAWSVVARRRSIPQPAYHVRIVEHLCNEACRDAVHCRSSAALELHDRIRRKFLTVEDSSTTIIDRGIVTADRSRSVLTLVNRETGQLQGEVAVPAAYWQLAGGGEGFCGQLLPVCGRSAHGLSLLEKRSLWSSQGEEDDQHRDKMKVGPVGHNYCVLQSSRRLSVIHPATGHLHWSRDDLPPGIGLLSNESTGIIGDEQTLTLFDADQLAYTVYRMRSGQRVRRGRLDLREEDARRHRRQVGDRLVHIASDADGDRLRVWDAGSDTILIDEPLHERLYAPIADCQQYAFLTSEGEFAVADIAAGRIILRMPLPTSLVAHATDLNVAIDPECYLVSIVRCDADDTIDAVAAMDEIELPAMRIQGRLLLITQSGQLRWSRPVNDAALLTSSRCRMPVLTLVSRVRDPQQRQSATLCVEVLDVRSGELLARRDDLRRTRFVQADYQHDRGLLTLVGLDSQIDIDFSAGKSEMLIHADVDPDSDPLVR